MHPSICGGHQNPSCLGAGVQRPGPLNGELRRGVDVVQEDFVVPDLDAEPDDDLVAGVCGLCVDGDGVGVAICDDGADDGDIVALGAQVRGLGGIRRDSVGEQEKEGRDNDDEGRRHLPPLRGVSRVARPGLESGHALTSFLFVKDAQRTARERTVRI